MTNARAKPVNNGLPRNPGGASRFLRFHRNRLLLFVRDQSRELRTTVQEPGTIRRTWHNLAGYTSARGSAQFSFTENAFDSNPSGPTAAVTTPFRYRIDTRNVLTVGNQLSNPMRRPAVPPRVTHSPPSLVMAGNVGYRPTVRTRIPSFGSRVPSLNGPGIPGTEQ